MTVSNSLNPDRIGHEAESSCLPGSRVLNEGQRVQARRLFAPAYSLDAADCG